MARRVYLHIGLPKTGTTFLQTTMWHNRRQLEAAGLPLPRFEADGPLPCLPGGAGHSAPRARAATPTPGTGSLRARSPGTARDWSATSSSAWPRAGPAQSRGARPRARRGPPRRHGARLPAPVPCRVAGGAQDELRPVLRRVHESGASPRELPRRRGAGRSQDIPAVLEPLGRDRARQRIHVVTVPPPDAPRSLLWTRWCQVLGLDDSTFDLDVHYANESLGAAQAALLQRVKPHLTGALKTGTVRHRWVRRYFGHEVLVPQGAPASGRAPTTPPRCVSCPRRPPRRWPSGGYDVTGDVADLVPAAAARRTGRTRTTCRRARCWTWRRRPSTG